MHSSKKRVYRNHSTHKQTPSSVITNRCSERVQQVHRRAFIPETHFNKVPFKFAVNRITRSINTARQNQFDGDFVSQSLHFLLFYIYNHY